MTPICRDNLMTLEAYAKARPDFRARAIARKRVRTVHIGPHVTLLFEDDLTIQYQIQEMLRAEKIFDESGIQDELDAYNPLIPDGRNFKATMLIEYESEAERKSALEKLKGIEDKTWIRVAGQEKIYAIADEDLDRENETKTSAVHFLRFELTHEMATALKTGKSLSAGVDHSHYTASVEAVAAETLASLITDLD